MSAPDDPGQKLDLLARELAEAREQQTAIGDILRVIANSPGDIKPVLDTVAERAARICEAQFADVMIVKDGRLHASGTIGDLGGAAARGGSQPLDRTTVMGRSIYDKSVIHVADPLAAEDEYPRSRQLAIRNGHRTILAVPLIREGNALGTILVRRTEVRPFEDKHIALLKTFADQAAIAIENARLLNALRQRTGELSEALEQQTAISDILRVISSSPGDVKPVFDTVAERAAGICEAQFVAIVLVEDGMIRSAAGQYGDLGGLAPGEGVLLDRTSVMGRSICDRSPVQLGDALNPGEEFPRAREFALRFGHRTILCVPLLHEGRALGTIVVRRTEVRPFEDKHIALLKTFADQAAIAIENARLLNELRQRTDDLSESLEQQTATADVLRVISSSPADLGPIFDAIVENAPRLCDASNVSLHRVEGDVMRQVASYGAIDTLKRGEARQITPGSLSGRAIIGRKIFHVADALAVAEAEFPDSRQAIEREGVRTALAVPLMQGVTPLGAIVIRRTEVRPFSDKQISLLKTFADQAVIAIENARLFNELRQRTDDLSEALEQQTATSEVLRVISSSPGELEPVFEAMLANATRICGASFGLMLLREGETLRSAAVHGDLAPEFLQQWQSGTVFRRDSALVAFQAAETRQPIQLADIRESPAYLARKPVAISAADDAGIRTMVTVPMLKDNETVGVIAIYRREVRPFTDKQIELVTNFAAQAVIAIENTRLLNELRQRTTDLSESLEQQTATSEVLKVISSSPGELEPVFNAMLANATRICEAKFGNLALLEGDALRMVALHGAPPAYAEERQRTPLIPLDSVLGRLVATKQRVHVADIAADENAARGPIVTKAGARTLLVVPMLKDDQLVGAIGIYRQEVRPFTEKQIELVTNFAAQAVIAIENTRLLNELRQRTDDLTESLEQQTATSEVLKVISSSRTDINPVFEAILDSACELCDSQLAAIFRFDGTLLHIAATKNWSAEALAQHATRWPMPPDPQMTSGRVVLTKDVVLQEDTLEDSNYDEAAARLGGWRRMLGVPMLREGQVIGVIVVTWREPGQIPHKQIELMKTFAAQAVIAVENVRLFTELRQRTDDLSESLEQQTATSEVLKVISSSFAEVGPVLDTIVRTASGLCEDADTIIHLRDGEHLRIAAHHGSIPVVVGTRRAPVRDWLAGRTVLEKRIIHEHDLLATGDEYPLGREIARQMGHRTTLGVPLISRGEAVGCLLLRRTVVQPFTEKQIALLRTFADQAVIAIENTRLLNEVRQQSSQLEAQSQELRTLNQGLEQRVDEQVGEIERMGRLRRFLPPQVADLIVSSGSEKQLESHRREITALFCDLRGFTGFSETSDPEDVMALLREYHKAIGEIIFRHGGTLERFAGDGVMVIFNDPVPLPNPALSAVQMALEMRAAIGALIEKWRRLGHELGFGIGISHGYATLGTIGFEGRFDYAAIGTVSNVASRLCDEAAPGQILVSPRVLLAVEDAVSVEPVREMSLKGIRRPMLVHNVIGANAQN